MKTSVKIGFENPMTSLLSCVIWNGPKANWHSYQSINQLIIVYLCYYLFLYISDNLSNHSIPGIINFHSPQTIRRSIYCVTENQLKVLKLEIHLIINKNLLNLMLNFFETSFKIFAVKPFISWRPKLLFWTIVNGSHFLKTRHKTLKDFLLA